MTTAADQPELAASQQEAGGQLMTTTPASNDGNNNEANDSNNNFGAENPAAAEEQSQSETPEITTPPAFVRPPALPPRPANLVLPHASRSFSHGLSDHSTGPYTIMPQGKLFFKQGVSISKVQSSLRRLIYVSRFHRQCQLICCQLYESFFR